MTTHLPRLVPAAGLALILCVPAVQAQYGYGYGAYGGYGYSPYGGYMNGSANVISSQGQFLVQYQKSKMEKERVSQAKIQTRRQNFDEWRYEQANTPTLEETRETARLENLARSRNDPPITEIWSGKALNDLLTDLQQMHSTQQMPTVHLDENMLRQINVTTGVGNGSIGVIKEGGQLRWPLVLRSKVYETERKQLDDLTLQAVKQAASNNVDPDSLNEMAKLVDTLQGRLKDNVGDISPNQYIDGKKFLRELNDAVTKLGDPNVANYFDKKWSAKGRNVSELVRYMTEQGLKFAPAVAGEEAAYTSLQRSMAIYDSSLHQMVRR